MVGKEGLSGAGPRAIELAENQLVELRGLHGHAPTDAFLLEFFGLLTSDPSLPRAWLRALPASLHCAAAPAAGATRLRARARR
jgi:hypothetical protein